jgi:hypothetical protein
MMTKKKGQTKQKRRLADMSVDLYRRAVEIELWVDYAEETSEEIKTLLDNKHNNKLENNK